jgi:hypothetical protein
MANGRVSASEEFEVVCAGSREACGVKRESDSNRPLIPLDLSDVWL